MQMSKTQSFLFSLKVEQLQSSLLPLLIFTQDDLFSTWRTVINEGPAIEALIVFKAPVWATEMYPLNQRTAK